jgi:DNA-binding MarR family transcriptional regulator
LVSRPGFLLARLGVEIKSRSIAEFAEDGLTPYHFSVLAMLDEGARETQATIADTLRLDRSQLVGLLDGLEQRGLVERRRDQLDRRRQAVSLTAEGRETLVRLRGVIDRIEAEFLAPLESQEREHLQGLLFKLAQYHDPRCAGE